MHLGWLFSGVIGAYMLPCDFSQFVSTEAFWAKQSFWNVMQPSHHQQHCILENGHVGSIWHADWLDLK